MEKINNIKSKIRINKVYTKNGDKGKTSLIGNNLIDKDDLRVEASARYMEVVEAFTKEPMQLEVGPVDESIYAILNPFAY